MANPNWHPAPAAGHARPARLSPTEEQQAAEAELVRRAAESVGREYGHFREWQENFLRLFEDSSWYPGVRLWDRLSPKVREEAIAKAQRAYDRLPPLPVAKNAAEFAAVREGFKRGAEQSYEEALIKTRAVWVAAELAKYAISARSALPRIAMIGSTWARMRDCSAHAASRAIQERLSIEIEADFLVRTWGLPRPDYTYKDAVANALNWFTNLGFVLVKGKFGPVREGGTIGKYIIFMEGGATGGHVVYGEVTSTGVRVIDNQIGRSWHDLGIARSALGMRGKTDIYQIQNIDLKFK